MAQRKEPRKEDDDSLLREIDFLILAAEQSGDTRDSIRLILASLRDTNSRLRGLADDVTGLRHDLQNQTEALPSIDDRLRKMEGKVTEVSGGSAYAEAVDSLRREWRSTKLFIVSLFLAGGFMTVCLVSLVILAQIYLVNP